MKEEIRTRQEHITEIINELAERGDLGKLQYLDAFIELVARNENFLKR